MAKLHLSMKTSREESIGGSTLQLYACFHLSDKISSIEKNYSSPSDCRQYNVTANQREIEEKKKLSIKSTIQNEYINSKLNLSI